MNNIKEEKKNRNKKQQRQVRFLKKETRLKSKKNFVNQKNVDTQEENNNFAVNINSIGKMLWQFQFRWGRLPAPVKPQLTS